MKTIKMILGAGWAGWAKVTLGLSRVAYRFSQSVIVASYSADKRAKRLGVGK